MTPRLREARAMLHAAREAGLSLAPSLPRSRDDEAVCDVDRYERRVRAAFAMLDDGQSKALLSMVFDAQCAMMREVQHAGA